MITLIALALLAVVLPLSVFDLVARPTIRRLGLRNVVRRRGEAALVVGGSMLATALIIASFVVGTSFETSIGNIAETRLGPVDEVVFVDDPARLVDLASALREAENIDGVLPVRRAVVAVGSVASDGGARSVEPRVSLLQFDIAAASMLGSASAPTGYEGVSGGGPSTAVLNRTLADDIGVVEGDPIDLFFGGQSIEFVVHRIVEPTALAGFAEIVVAPGSVEMAAAATDRDLVQAVAPEVLLVSNRGGVFDGADLTEAAIEEIETVASALAVDVSVTPLKQRLLADAEAEGASMTELFGTIGGFSVAAGILLVINLFVMLAGERTVELGTMRALGLKRGTILRSFALEGAIYGLLAALAGALVGSTVAAGVIAFAANVFDGDGLRVGLHVTQVDLLSGAAIGFAISQLTVIATSFRTTRVNIVRALKDLPPQRPERAPWRRLVVGLVGVATGGVLFVLAPSDPYAAMAGPVLAAVAAIGPLSLIVSRKTAVVIGCGAALVWPIMVFSVRADALADPDVGIFLLQGVLLVGLATALLASLDRLWLRATERIANGGIGARLGMAHPLARPARSAMLVAMYALVIFTVTFMAVMNSAFMASSSELATQAGGGYTMVVDSNETSPLTGAQLASVTGVQSVSAVRRGAVEAHGLTWSVSTVDASWHPELAPEASELAAPFATSREAWAAVADGGSWIMAPDGGWFEAGESLELLSPSGAATTVTVAGVVSNGWLVGAELHVPESIARELWTNDVPVDRFYVSTMPGLSAEVIADGIQARWPEQGAEAVTFLGRAQAELETQESFFQMLQGYLGLGLLIGIAGLGVVLVRSVRERRRELGMLSAIGVPVGQAQRAFLVEATFIGAQGVLLGIGLGLASAWQVVTRTAAFAEGLSFDVPVLWLAGLTALALLASVGAAIVPARRAGQVPPAVALRVTT